MDRFAQEHPRLLPVVRLAKSASDAAGHGITGRQGCHFAPVDNVTARIGQRSRSVVCLGAKIAISRLLTNRNTLAELDSRRIPGARCRTATGCPFVAFQLYPNVPGARCAIASAGGRSHIVSEFPECTGDSQRLIAESERNRA